MEFFMPNPIETILLLVALFALFLAFSFMICIVYKTNSEVRNATKTPSKKKSITNSYHNKKPKNPRRKKPDVPIKSTVISPSEFKSLSQKNGKEF